MFRFCPSGCGSGDSPAAARRTGALRPPPGRPGALSAYRPAGGLSPVVARTLLAKFRIGAEVVLRPADTLSPGERTRAGLALFQARGSTCLILDEPTNHLDLPAIEQLEQALATYQGTLLLVTHDRRLAATVAITRELDLPGCTPGRCLPQRGFGPSRICQFVPASLVAGRGGVQFRASSAFCDRTLTVVPRTYGCIAMMAWPAELMNR